MRSTCNLALSGFLLCVCLLLPPFARAADASDTKAASTVPASLTAPDVDALLEELQAGQNKLRQRAAEATRDAELAESDALAREMTDKVQLLLATSLMPWHAKLQEQLDVLAPVPTPGAEPETPAVALQRRTLGGRLSQLDVQIRQAQSIRDNLAKLHKQISRLQHDRLSDLLALRSSSILQPRFWAPLVKPDPGDSEAFWSFNALLLKQFRFAWQTARWPTTALLLLSAFAFWAVGPRAFESAIASLCLRRLPEGRLRRSALAIATTIASVVSTACVVEITYVAMTRRHPLVPPLDQVAENVMRLSLICASVSGLGRALLSAKRPSWRLPVIADEVVLAISPIPRLLAVLLIVFGTVEQINRVIDSSLEVTLFARGLVSLVVVLVIGAALIRVNRVRNTMAAAGKPPEARSTLAGMLHAGITVTVVVALFALLAGYITLSRFLTYELVWVSLVLCSFYLLTRLTQDVFENLFSVQHASGKTFRNLFGVEEAHLDQTSTVLSGLATSLLLFVAVVALLTGGFGTTPADLFNDIVEVFGGDRLRSLNIVPSRVLNAGLTLAVGLYLLRSVHRWLDRKFLPKTGMGVGMRASLLALFTNIGYVAIALLTLSALGVRWDNLAWVVSALSVGIGFGLQEIVKNFVSGLILLTERPVKVGDMVSISGVEGDIRRINVRATEIQLADRSTVIVPNSQLISQNLRNVTMGNTSLGVATLILIFPLDIDPERVRDLLLQTFLDHPAILEQPGPSVLFSDLTPAGITLSVTGYVRSPRITGSAKSDLLFEVLRRLRDAGIPLSNPQTLVVRRSQHDNLEQQPSETRAFAESEAKNCTPDVSPQN
ncbi:DUF3772 domain-containing protein [Caballeronia sp. LZ001]|uniref:DUF3772 domain-containing protein n=1 Tax=Caballeronia sp. LZ001 TaxID=3038553 RepID=UPI002865523C|nr:DUF3772 domain-containing protein [Caballeronia sp. LZ001]MDR5804801.1 DUF3772 domain-containing protein [Caballeronia sp. LZ001]